MPTDRPLKPLQPRNTEWVGFDAVIAIALVALCAAIIAGLSWTRPTAVASTITYTQSGQLSYGAPTSAGSAYGSTGLTTGSPVYGSVVSSVDVSFAYRLHSVAGSDIAGTERLVATISNGQGLSRVVPVQAAATAFVGRRFTAAGTLQLSTLKSAVATFAQVSGGLQLQSFSVAISPSVSAHGRVAGEPLSTSFSPSFYFTYADGNLLPGGSSATGGKPNFTSTSSGSVSVPGGQPATLFLGISVAAARIASIAVLIAALALGGLAGWPLLRRARSKDERERIRARYGSLVVEADGVSPLTGTTVVELASFDDVLQVAKRLECPIVHWGEGGDVYAVVDSGTLYRYLSGTPSGSEFRQRPAPNGSGWVRGQSVAVSERDATPTEEARRGGNGVVTGRDH